MTRRRCLETIDRTGPGAVYPLLVTDADGQSPSGENNSVIHFDADKLPPVDAFWSITMYDAEGYPVANEINRFVIGDRDPLQYNADGSLDLYLQQANPGPDEQVNWLPAPPGKLGVDPNLIAHPDCELSIGPRGGNFLAREVTGADRP